MRLATIWVGYMTVELESSKSQPEGLSNDEIKTTEMVRNKADVDTLVEAGDALVRIRELVQCLDDALLMYLIDMAILKASEALCSKLSRHEERLDA